MTLSGLITAARAAAPLQIVSEPADTVVAAGSNIALTVEATGSPAPAYQWALNGEPIPGAVRPTLNYLYYTPTSSASVGASDYFGFNLSDHRGAYGSARVFISITQ